MTFVTAHIHPDGCAAAFQPSNLSPQILTSSKGIFSSIGNLDSHSFQSWAISWFCFHFWKFWKKKKIWEFFPKMLLGWEAVYTSKISQWNMLQQPNDHLQKNVFMFTLFQWIYSYRSIWKHLFCFSTINMEVERESHSIFPLILARVSKYPIYTQIPFSPFALAFQSPCPSVFPVSVKHRHSHHMSLYRSVKLALGQNPACGT